MFVWDEQGGELVPNTAPDTDNNTAALPPAAAGPRHLAFHPNLSTVAYSVNELSSTVVRWDFDPNNGWLSADFEAEPQRIVSTLPPGTPAGCPIRQAGTGCAVQARVLGCPVVHTYRLEPHSTEGPSPLSATN